ncbi:MAG: UDP-N-acetylmuramoyl-L-alanyl-D-glutamate--2,6-diaminopimelate ligase [Bacilli bacterium]
MNIKTNSKYVKKNDIFICTHDELEDRHNYIKDIKRASAIIVDKDIKKQGEIPLIKVNNTNDALYDIYSNYYENPLKNLNIIAVTGTDGKTTTASIIKQLLENFEETAYLGTNGFIYKEKKITTKNTTPAINTILKYASTLKEENIKNLVMETSSEGLLHNRCQNLRFKRAIITNVTGDHLNVHKTFENYLNSKLKLFKLLEKDGIAIINTDDISYNHIKKMKINTISYGSKKNADYKIENIKEEKNKTTFTLKHKDKTFKIESPLLGKFNVYNLTSAIICLNSLDIDLKDIIKNIKNIKPISGRMNIFYTKKKAQIILDYAHTLKSTTEILTFANKIKEGKIITVVGSAGGREKEKRKDIGKIVTELSDEVILTTDDPRYEKVENIVKDLTKTCTKNNYIFIKSRKKAIKTAIKKANQNDLILILGKGTDNYMAIKNKYKKYSDLKIIKKYI